VGVKFGKFTHFEHLAKKDWQMNRFSQKVIIVNRNLDDFVWRIACDLPNSPNFLPAKLSCYMVASTYLLPQLICMYVFVCTCIRMYVPVVFAEICSVI